MNFAAILCFCFATAAAAFSANIKLQPQSVAVFAGGPRSIPFTLSNITQQRIDQELSFQLLQASSTTVALIQTVEHWKRVILLPQQNLNEQAAIELPNVRAATRFLLRLAEDRSVLGSVEIWAYPSNLLSGLNVTLAGEPIIL